MLSCPGLRPPTRDMTAVRTPLHRAGKYDHLVYQVLVYLKSYN